MAKSLVDSGPFMDWTRDNQIYDRFKRWKTKVELHFSSTLADCTLEQKSAYLRLWMGDEGLPLIMKWTDTGKLNFGNPDGENPSSGFLPKTYWKLLDEELKPKGNKLISIQELFSPKARQGTRTFTEWLTYVYNLVEACNYGDSKDRIIRDVLFIGCNSTAAKDSIIRKGEDVQLQDVINILQLEDSTKSTLHYINSSQPDSTAQVHYASYEKNQKSRKKTSTEQNTDSTNSKRLCYRCGEPYSKEHKPKCRAQNATCNACGKTVIFRKFAEPQASRNPVLQ